MPNFTKDQFITIRFKNYQPYYAHFGDNEIISSHNEMSADITLDFIDTNTYILQHNNVSHEWHKENIKLQPLIWL